MTRIQLYVRAAPLVLGAMQDFTVTSKAHRLLKRERESMFASTMEGVIATIKAKGRGQ